jgi:hypothetical protein
VEYVTDNAAKNHTAGVKSGVAVGVSGYIGVKLADALSVHFRADTYNPDTLVKFDEMNTFIVGMNVKLTSMTVLQLNYQLDKFVHTLHGASDNNLTNNNQFLAQLVWSW